MRHERVRGDRAETTGFEILQRLHDFISGVHHERAVMGNGLPNWPPAKYEELETRRRES